jgi:hypothetical protein
MKIIRLIKLHKYSIVTLLLGALYFWVLTLAHDNRAGDFQSFVNQPMNLDYGFDRWFEWSSRLLIETSVNVFSKHLTIWKVVTICLGAVLLWSLGRLLGNRRIWQSILLFSLLLLTSSFILTSAGIFATTINYMWPIASFAFVLAIVFRPFSNKKLVLISRVLAIPMFVFAMCSEQLAVLSLILLTTFVLYCVYKKKSVERFVWVLLGLTIVGVVNVLICPGNSARTALEIINWWPGFEMLNIQQKLINGVIVTLSRLLYAPETLAIILIFSLLVVSYLKKNIKAFFAILPASTLTILAFFPHTAGIIPTHIRSPNYFNEIREIAINLSPEHLAPADIKKVYIIIFAIVLVSIMVSILYLYGKTKKTLTLLTVLGAGMVVSLAVSTSPTIFASNTRTLYPMVIILIYVDFVIIRDFFNARFDDIMPKPLTGKQGRKE